MSTEDVKDRIVEVIIRDLELTVRPEEVHGTARLDDLFGMDSIAITELVIGIEKEFQIRLPAEDLSIEIFRDLESLTGYVKKLLQKGQDKTEC